MKKIISPLMLAMSLAVAGSALAQTAPAAPESTLSFNVGAVSEYRYRGYSQTRFEPAVQGGADYADKSGAYIGIWGSNIEWIKDTTRGVPILCTGNELPTIFRRNVEHIDLIRCFPPKALEVQSIFKLDITEIIKDCQHDIRKLTHRIQYGISDIIPKYLAPPTGLPVEKAFLLRQKMFDLPDSLCEYRIDIQDSEPKLKTKSQYKRGGKHGHIAESDKLPKK